MQRIMRHVYFGRTQTMKKKRMKPFMKMQIWCIILVLVLFLAGCRENTETNQYLEISYKTNRHVPFGIFAAEYREKIYYYSDENGQTGIYQMDLEGSNPILCIPCEDIRGIQIINDWMYILMRQNTANENEIYNVMKCSLDGKLMKTVLDDELYKYYVDDQYGGVNKFFIDEKENFFFHMYGYGKRKKITTSTYYQKEQWEPIGKFVKELTKGSIRVHGGNYFYIYQIGNNYLVNNAGIEVSKRNSNSSLYRNAVNAYGYSATFNRPWWNNTANADKWDGESKIWNVSGNEIILSMNNVLFSYDIENGEIVWEKEVPVDELTYFNEEIVHVLCEEEKIYILLEYNTPSIFQEVQDESGQVLYCLNCETGIIEEIHNCGTDGKIIYIEKGFFVSYENNAFRLYKKENEQWREIWDYTINTQIKDIGYQIDIAENWLFVKQFDRESKKASLVEKINIALWDVKNPG